jgi:hypothetical protein
MLCILIYLKLEEKCHCLPFVTEHNIWHIFQGGEVAPSNTREYGRANLSYIKRDEVFFEGVPDNSQVWMSHSDTIKKLPTNGIRLPALTMLKMQLTELKVKLPMPFSFIQKCIILPMENKCWKIFGEDCSSASKFHTQCFC